MPNQGCEAVEVLDELMRNEQDDHKHLLFIILGVLRTQAGTHRSCGRPVRRSSSRASKHETCHLPFCRDCSRVRFDVRLVS